MKKSIVVLFIGVLLLSACSQDYSTKNLRPNCPFEENDNMDGKIDETEFETMSYCVENKITKLSELQDNLIGEWELIGFGASYQPQSSQPCVLFTFSDSELEIKFENAITDTISMHTWEINEIPDFGPVLKITPGMYGIHISYISPDFMFGDDSMFDGNMYLFEKK